MTDVYELNGATVIAVSGEFDVANAQVLESTLGEVAPAERLLVADLSKAEYIDSSVLAVLMRRKRALGENFRIVVPEDSKVRLIFRVAGLLEVLAIAPSLESALS